MRTGRPRRQGRLTSSFIECPGGSEPTPIRMKGCARGFVATGCSVKPVWWSGYLLLRTYSGYLSRGPALPSFSPPAE